MAQFECVIFGTHVSQFFLWVLKKMCKSGTGSFREEAYRLVEQTQKCKKKYKNYLEMYLFFVKYT